MNSELKKIESAYTVESVVQSSKDKNVVEVKTVEELTSTGKPFIKKVEDYPMVQAANWAISKTEDEAILRELKTYLQNTIDGVNDSIEQGEYEIVWIIQHQLTMDKKTNRILSDSYTDEATDNINGTDKVTWVDGHFMRNKPDLTLMPDYVINHTPIEELGQDLLDEYTKVFSGTDRKSGTNAGYYYNRTNARWYITEWVEVTSKICDADPLTYQDVDVYNNLDYRYFWCDDCANYVSQALRYGNHTTTSTWQPYTIAWKYVPNLTDFLLSNGRGYLSEHYTQLTIGDLGFIPGWHVVMVSGINPWRYSGHTSDRLNATWHPDLTQYMKIFDYPIY